MIENTACRSASSSLMNDYADTFSDLFRMHYQPLVEYAKRIIADRYSAEDIVADIFLKYWDKKAAFVSEGRSKGFLFVSVRNACYNHLKHQQAKHGKALCFLHPCYDGPVLDTITKREILKQANLLVESLPPECRKVIKMSLLHGQDNQEIAGKLDVSVHTVRNQKTRGIKLMQQRFARLQNG